MGYVIGGCGEHPDCTFRFVPDEPTDDLPPIDGDDTGEFSAEHVRPILREDVDEWDYDRWSDMA